MRQSLCFLFIINTSICSFTGTRELLGTTVFYVARTDTHTISLVVSHLYTFLKKKNLSCDTEIFPITLTQQQQRKEQGVEASSAEWGPWLGDPKDHRCIYFLGGQRMVMECCLQWKPRIQNVQGQRNLRKWSKAFYLWKSISHFPKGLGRGPIPNFTVTELWDHRTPWSPQLLLPYNRAELRAEGILDASFQVDWVSMLKGRCKVSDRN